MAIVGDNGDAGVRSLMPTMHDVLFFSSLFTDTFGKISHDTCESCDTETQARKLVCDHVMDYRQMD